MNIILEGPDNCGKSTLANAISAATGWPIHPKEGRPENHFLLLEKLRRYEQLEGVIIDRHPIISGSVYRLMRGDPEFPDAYMDRFFAGQDLIIYCRCLRSLEDHEPSPTDTPEHLHNIQVHQQRILDSYDNWAAIAANIIYTTYDQTPMIVAMVKGVLQWKGVSV